MLKQLIVRRFKSIKEATVALSQLNLFVGANSAGKSSAIQALMLALDNNMIGADEQLCEMVHLRTSSFNELRCFVLNAKSFEIHLDDVPFMFRPADDNMIQTTVQRNSDKEGEHTNILYLPAMRNADLSHAGINSSPRNNPLGRNGEYVIDYYYNHHKDVLPQSLIVDKTLETLEGQVNCWLNKLTGYNIQVLLQGSEYQVRFEDPNKKMLSPIHVGTGISFIVELLIVCLSAKKGDVIIIENPEIHLHPSAQASIIDFLAMIAANSSAQLFIESHSDHLFNGIRRLLHEEKLKLNEVSVYYFTRDENGLSSAQEVQLSQYGGLKNYIPGMFDQFDEDLDAILK